MNMNYIYSFFFVIPCYMNSFLFVSSMICLITLIYMVVMAVSQKNPELNFLILGDWGGESWYPYTTSIEQHTAKQMANVAYSTNASFVLALGDNFYEYGVKNVYDKRFEETFVNVFNSSSLNIPWYVVGGNHDHRGNISAQIAYTKYSKKWIFPDLWHSHKVFILGTNITLKYVLLDTVVLCGISGSDDGHMQPQGADNMELAEKQWSWLEEQLKYSKDDYLIVGGHYPVWSVAEHGPTQCLVERLKPMLEKYNVNTYVCGHDHNLQFIREEDSSVNYFVIGAADKIENSRKHEKSIPKPAEHFFWADENRYGGFGHIRITKSSMTVNLIDSLGATVLSKEIKPRQLF